MKLLYSSGLLFLFAGSQTIFTSALDRKHNLRRNFAVGDKRQLEHHGAGNVNVPAPVHAPVPRPANVPHGQNLHPTSNDSYHNGPEPQGYTKMQPYSYSYPYPNGNDPPTPNPSDRPTPLPTPRPTSMPTPNPTPSPTPQPTPSPTTQPSPAPSPQPSAVPSPQPSAVPSPQPSAEPSAQPSDTPSGVPSISPAPSSVEPTYSDEPSENPTQSEEPSENPTQSEEPSENPTQSEEPSQNPTASEEPSQSPTRNDVDNGSRTIAAIICDSKNAITLSTLCTAIETVPAVFALLNDLSFNLNGDIIPVNIPPRLPVNVGERNLQGVSSGQRLTMFAPNNQAFENFYQTRFNQLFDAGSPEVVAYFNNLGINVESNSALVSANFFLSANGERFLTELLLGHIITRERTDSQLICNSLSSMENGKTTVTHCDRNVNNNTNRKYQVGSGNNAENAPKLIQKDLSATNGIIHVVNNVIITELEVPSNTIQLDENFFSPPDVVAAP